LAVVTYAITCVHGAGARFHGGGDVAFSDHEIPNPRFARLAEDLIQTFLAKRIPMLVLGVLPLFVLPFIYAQWFVGTSLVPLKYLFIPIPGVIVALVVLSLYARSFAERATNFNLHMGLGTLGVGLLKVSYLILLATVARFQDPEKWFRIKDLVILLLNWNVIYKFLFFVHLAFAAGAAILFFLFPLCPAGSRETRTTPRLRAGSGRGWDWRSVSRSPCSAALRVSPPRRGVRRHASTSSRRL
jgi:hypothetical protein